MRKLRKEWKRDVSVVMTALLVCGSVGIPAEAGETGSWVRSNALTAIQRLEPEVKTAEAELSNQDKKQLEKEETVYVIANADGSPQKLIVSDWLKNAMGKDALEDTTELTDIVNVKGDEGFQKKEGSLGVWDAAGNDIYYQGNIQKELPVDMKITYRLNDKVVSPEELAGQSGRVNIRFDYTNRQKETVLVGEQEEELYVPFVLLTSMVLDNESFHNIEISNGKVINDGERTIVMGYAMPGLKDNLDIGSEDFDVEELDIPDYVELTADVTDFELATTLTVATNEIFGDMDLDTQEKMDDLTADMDELEDAMNELMDGTAELYDGVLELYDGTGELTDGVEELNDGARELQDGADELYNGTGTLKSGVKELAAGIAELSAGLGQLAANNAAIMQGATEVFQSLLDQANRQLSPMGIPTLTIENYAQVLEGAIKQMQGAVTNTLVMPADLEVPEQEFSEEITVQDTVEEKENTTEEKETTEDVAEKTENEITEEPEDKEELTDEAETNMDTEKQENIGEAEKQEAALAPSAEVEIRESVIVKASVEDGAQAAAARNAAQIEALKGLKASLDKYNQFYQGLKAYTQGVADANQGAQALLAGSKKLEDGASELRDGAGRLKDGTSELKDGTHELKDGSQELKDGVEELRDGSKELKDGTIEFNEEGIQKLLDMFNGDLQELSDRLDAVKSAAKEYQSFSGISDGVQGNVRFIYKTAAIEK